MATKTSWFSRLGAGLKALAQPMPRGNWSMLFDPTPRINYRREVGDGLTSSALMACLLWICRTFPEAPIRLSELVGPEGVRTPLDRHLLVKTINRPNPYYSGVVLWMATLLDLNITGNAYWRKGRNTRDSVVEYWYTPSFLIEPQASKDDPSVFIDHYDFAFDPGRNPERIAVRDIVHFRYGIDPRNTRKGLAPLMILLREIFTDEEAGRFAAALLKNMAIPGMVIAPSDDAFVDDETAETLKEAFTNKFGGDRRGEPLVAKSKISVTKLSWSPSEMNLTGLRRLPEERISAVTGVPAIVAGLGAGLDRSTFANFAEARESGIESTIIPLQRMIAADVQNQILPDFELEPDRFVVDFDLANVRVLQEDQNKLAARVTLLWRSDIYKRSQALELLGETSDAGDDLYYSEWKMALAQSSTPADPAALPSGPDPAALPDPAGSAARARRTRRPTMPFGDYVALLDGDKARVRTTFVRHLAEAFSLLADEVVLAIEQLKDAGDDWPPQLKRIADGQSTADSIIPGHVEESLFRPEYAKALAAAADSAFARASQYLGTKERIALEDHTARELIRQGANGIVQVRQQTRDAIAKSLADGLAANESRAQLIERVSGMIQGRALYPGVWQQAHDARLAEGGSELAAVRAGNKAARLHRATVIADHEIHQAQNRASVLAYRRSGLVSEVEIIDGVDCGWTQHQDPDKADGSVRSLDEFDRYPAAHPGCQRRANPIVSEKGPIDGA